MNNQSTSVTSTSKQIPIKKNLPQVLFAEDLTHIADQYLSDRAKQDMENQASTYSQHIIDDNGTAFTLLSLGNKVREENPELAVSTLCSVLNYLSEANLIHSCIGPIQRTQASKLFGETPSVTVLCYLYVPVESLAEIENKFDRHIIKIGSQPTSLEDLTLKLLPGEFLAQIRIHFSLLSSESPLTFYEDQLQNSISEYLSFLPKNTKVLETTELPTFHISQDYEVKFYNPLLARAKHIEPIYVREFAQINDRFIQGNVLVKINYLDENKQSIY